MTWAEETVFPLRKKYPNVITISPQSLYKKFNHFIIIDVRSQFEFEILHINNALNVPIANMGFIPTLKKIRKNDSRAIVFYCNGITCEKSYQASITAQQKGVNNIFTFDSGIMHWAKLYPNLATLLEKSPIVLTDLISEQEFLAHNLTPKLFANKIDKNSLVLDIREPFQREKVILQEMTVTTSLDKFKNVIKHNNNNNKTLLIYDAVGKQTRWLQYIIKKQGIKEYNFMKGGVRAFFQPSS